MLNISRQSLIYSSSSDIARAIVRVLPTLQPHYPSKDDCDPENHRQPRRGPHSAASFATDYFRCRSIIAYAHRDQLGEQNLNSHMYRQCRAVSAKRARLFEEYTSLRNNTKCRPVPKVLQFPHSIHGTHASSLDSADIYWVRHRHCRAPSTLRLRAPTTLRRGASCFVLALPGARRAQQAHLESIPCRGHMQLAMVYGCRGSKTRRRSDQ